MHFGAGNIFRAFPAAVLNDALNSGKYDRGVIVADAKQVTMRKGNFVHQRILLR